MISTFSFLCPSVNLVTAKMYSCARAFVIVIVIVKHLKKMAVHDARRWGKKDSLEIKLFFQRLSVTLQRGNAALLVERDIEPV